MIVYSNGGTTPPFDYGTTATYQCNDGYNLANGDIERTCTGNGTTSVGQWSGTAPHCSRMFYYCNRLCYYIHTQLWTVGLLRLLPMDLLGYQQPQHSQGQL